MRRRAYLVQGLKGRRGAINHECAVCGFRFLREAGYFLGVATKVPVAVLLAIVFEWHLALILGIMLAQMLLSVPPFFRYSRVNWLNVDCCLDTA